MHRFLSPARTICSARSLGAADHDPCDPGVAWACCLDWTCPRRRSQRFPSPSIPGPTPCGRTGPISTAPGNSGSTPGTRASQRAGRSPARRASTGRSSSRSPGRASCPESTRPKGAPKVAWYRRRFTSPRSFPADQRSGSGSARSTGGPTSGSTAGRSPSTRGDIRRSRPTSPMPSIATGENILVVRAFDPTDPEPADRQAGRLVHAQLGHLADRLARGPAEDLHRRLPDRDPTIEPATVHVRRRGRRLRPGEVPARPASRSDRHVERRRRRFRPAVQAGRRPGKTTLASSSTLDGAGREALDPRDARALRRDARAQGRQRAR